MAQRIFATSMGFFLQKKVKCKKFSKQIEINQFNERNKEIKEISYRKKNQQKSYSNNSKYMNN